MIRVVPKTCPICGRSYTEEPALSRVDNATMICPDCGIGEALDIFGCDDEEKKHIIGLVHKYYEKRRNRI